MVTTWLRHATSRESGRESLARLKDVRTLAPRCLLFVLNQLDLALLCGDAEHRRSCVPASKVIEEVKAVGKRGPHHRYGHIGTALANFPSPTGPYSAVN
jgi:hypothetical protein